MRRSSNGWIFVIQHVYVETWKTSKAGTLNTISQSLYTSKLNNRNFTPILTTPFLSKMGPSQGMKLRKFIATLEDSS
jgi:hypothetical protein